MDEPKGVKNRRHIDQAGILIGNSCAIFCMMGARRWPKSAVELPPGQMQFGRPPTYQAGLVILGDTTTSFQMCSDSACDHDQG